jgi:dGTPase
MDAIMTYDQATVEFAKQMEVRVEPLKGYRLQPENDRDDRDPLDRDYSRILYSSSFRRLQGKMQLLGIHHAQFFRNRLTHSLEVAQIAREIAKRLKLDDEIVTQACALAHDLGNPPFGHAGEKVLHDLVKDIGGFEGNAQLFRILTTLEKRHRECDGLNLTLRTLLGTVKYFKQYDREKEQDPSDKQQKFLYDEDYKLVKQLVERHNLSKQLQTIDMQVMDLADEIAYAAHDLEDSLSAGYFTIDELLEEFACNDDYKSAHGIFKDIVDECRKEAAPSRRKNYPSEEFAAMFKRRLTSCIVDKLVRDIAVIDNAVGYPRLGLKDCERLSKGLKKLTFRAVSRKPHIQHYEKKGEKVIRGLYAVYTDWTYNKELQLLPPEYRDSSKSDEPERRRRVVDFIAGMMDAYAVEQFTKYYGASELDKLYQLPSHGVTP